VGSSGLPAAALPLLRLLRPFYQGRGVGAPLPRPRPEERMRERGARDHAKGEQMALEINEIAIQMQVGESAVEPEENQPEDMESGDGALDYDLIVEECVRRVLQTIKTMKER